MRALFAHAACRGVGCDHGAIAATRLIADAAELLADPDVDVVVEATGVPAAGIAHARGAFADARHIDEGCAPDAGKFGKALAAGKKVQEPVIGDLSRDFQQTGTNSLEVACNALPNRVRSSTRRRRRRDRRLRTWFASGIGTISWSTPRAMGR